MRKWRSARLRRLYGTPQDQLEDNAAVEVVKKKEKKEPAAAPPPSKRVKREKTRPESEYNLVCDMPVTFAEPNYNLLVNPLSEQKSKVASYAVNSSRLNIVNGTMLEPCWTRKPKSPEFEHLAAPHVRDKMTNLHDCLLTFGPHTLNVKLVTVRDDLVHLDEEEEKAIKRELHPELEKKETEKDKDNAKDVKPEPSSDTKPVNEFEQGNKGNSSAAIPAADKPDSAANLPSSNSEKPKEPEKLKDSQNFEDRNTDCSKPEAGSNAQAEDSNEPKKTESESNPKPEQHTPVETSNSEPKSPTKASQEQSKQDQSPHEPESSNSGSNTPSEPVKESQVPDSPKKPSTGDPVEVKEEVPETASSPPAASQSSNAEPVKRKRGRPKKIKPDSDEPEPKSEPKRRGRKPGPGITIDPNISKHVGKRASRLKFEEEEIFRKNKKQAEKAENAKKLETKNKDSEKEVKDANEGSSTGKPNQQSSESSKNSQSSPNKQPQPAQPQSQPQPQPQQPRPPQPQPQPQQQSQQPAPNQLVVQKLQQMAAKNPELSVLMKNVASGTASPEDIHAFQTIITRVKMEVMNLQKPKYKAVPILPPKYTSRAIMLALEFEENPNDRFLLPKHSILEYLEKTREVLWSFIVINDTYYTPVTFKFSGIPLGVFEIMAKCVRPKEIVHYKMQKNMQQFKRSEYMNIWFQIEKQDEVLIDLIKKVSPPTYQVPAQIVKRQVRRRPRLPQIEQTAGPVASEASPQTKPATVYKPQPTVSKSRMDLPLETRPTYVRRVGEPMIQVPSYVRTQFRPQLNLPDPRKLNLPRDLPPLPPSMRHL